VTTGAEIAGLKWIADFLKSVLSAVAGDRLKKTDSATMVKVHVFRAYGALADLKTASASFVSALKLLPSEAAQKGVEVALNEVSFKLVALETSLNGINPQLDIHAPEVASL
jgi:hypothetical protein